MIIQKYYDKDTYRVYVVTIIDDNGIAKKNITNLTELRKFI